VEDDEMRAFYTVSTIVTAALFSALLAAAPVTAQQTCAEIEAVILACSPDREISGEPPSCACDGVPVEPLELTCERNFGCPVSTEIGNGEWPNCACVPAQSQPDGSSGTGNGGSPDIGPSTSLGGSHTCEMFFECPSGAEMEVEEGRCTCTLVMLPQFKE
jgi:hypothetical protein